MSLFHIATRSAANWRERLARPDTQWQRGHSALETAVSWESAALSGPSLPHPIANLFVASGSLDPELLLAIPEHKVALLGRGGDSQCDVWALVRTSQGTVSLSVEAKAKEPFGKQNETLTAWLQGADSPNSAENRKTRWQHVRENLPCPAAGDYSTIPFQLLQRCASSVIEARRFGLTRAAFIVQSFGCPESTANLYNAFCRVIGISSACTTLGSVRVGNLHLDIGWAECPFASDQQIVAVL